MNYEFSLNKTSVLSLIAGSLVFGFLLFIAGLVVGSFWLTNETAIAPSTTAKKEKDELPKEPVLNEEEEEATAPTTAAPKKVDAAAAPLKEPAAPAGPQAAAAAATGHAASTATATPFKDEIRIIQEADPTDAVTETDPEYVTVQVGVFLDENEANRLLKQIESKGYSPSFFTGRDAEARQWFAVRIGAYSDKNEAANAAANFSKQEKLKAVVRPVGSL